MTNMTTSNLYLTTAFVDTNRTARIGRAGLAPKAAMTDQPNVVNPFARRPLGEPMSFFERVAVLAILAVLGAFLAAVLVRADGAALERSAATQIDR
jgi:hypothetical protein